MNDYWEDGNIPWLSSGEVHKKFIYFTDKFITPEGYNHSSTKMIPINSVLIALAGQGKTRGTVAINKIKLCTNQSIASIIPNKMLNYKYLFYYLESKYEYLRALSSSDGGRGGLNLKLIKSIPIQIPSIKEQEIISNFINGIDQKIRFLEKKYQYYQDFKKYLMQQIFTQKLRFGDYPEWRKTVLKSILNERKQYTTNMEMFPHVTLSKKGILPKSERFDREFLVKDKNKKYKITYFGDICYNPANLKFGVITLNTFGSAIFSPIYVTFEVKNVDKYYLSYFLTRDNFINKVRKYEEGTVYERMAVKPKDFLKENIMLPSIEEQQKISSFLLLIDKKISRINENYNKLINFKKGLLQQMFV